MEEANKKKGPSGIEYIEVIRKDNTPGYKLNNGIVLDHIPEEKDCGTNNLKPNVLTDRTKEEQKQLAIKAGKRSGEVRKAKREQKDSMKMLLSIVASGEIIADTIPEEIKALLPGDMDLYDLMNARQLLEALQGSERHATYCRDTAGYKPTDKQEITADVITDGDRQLINKLCKRVNGDQE